AGSHRKNFMWHIGRKRHERAGLWRNVERLRPIEAERATLALLACVHEEHHDGDAPRELFIRVGQQVTMSSIESAGDVSEKTRTFVVRQRYTEETRDTLTNTDDRTLDLLHRCGIDVHLQCPAYLAINDEPVGLNFSGCPFTALHRSAYAVAPLPIAEVRKDENCVSSGHPGRDSRMDAFSSARPVHHRRGARPRRRHFSRAQRRSRGPESGQRHILRSQLGGNANLAAVRAAWFAARGLGSNAA